MKLEGNKIFSGIKKLYEKQFLRYLLSSLFSGSVELASFYLMNSTLGLNYVLAAVISFCFSTVAGYVAKRKVAFQNKYRPRRKQFAVFLAVTLGGVIINTGVVILFVETAGAWPTLAKLAGILIAFVYNYFASKYFTFKVMR